MNNITIFFIVFLSLSSCATAWHRSVTSGQIGCDENELQITDVSSSIGGQTWKASCKGKRFFCSSMKGSAFVGEKVTTCKEAL